MDEGPINQVQTWSNLGLHIFNYKDVKEICFGRAFAVI